jgi:1-acyl-sn-glycerol-3-phosphate acyltransferase
VGGLRTFLDAAVGLTARTLTGVFFRQVAVLDAGRVPRGRPLVVVANHENSLVDAVLLTGFLGVRPRFLAKSTLWSHPVVAPLLVFAGAVPVYRRQDVGAGVAQNAGTFARCHAELAQGAVVALFPEGTSHNRPHRLPLKTGAARIALEAEARYGPLGLRIVPVGLIYDDKGRFRSRVIVQVGPPIDPAPEASAWATGRGAAVRRLTERMAAALAEVTLNHASWEEARLVGRASALLAEAPPGRAPTLAEVWPIRQRVWRAYQALRRQDPARADALVRDLGQYEHALGARDAGRDDTTLPAGSGPPEGTLKTSWPKLALAAPFALVGIVLNVVPYRIVDAIARRRTRTPDEPATYKVLGAMFLFPFFWAVQAALVGSAAGARGAAAALLAAPITGYVALRWSERLGEWRTQRRWRRGSLAAGAAALAEQRDRLRDQMRALLESLPVSG